MADTGVGGTVALADAGVRGTLPPCVRRLPGLESGVFACMYASSCIDKGVGKRTIVVVFGSFDLSLPLEDAGL